jgi:endothelin-converting enzyme/putative endopeptidase
MSHRSIALSLCLAGAVSAASAVGSAELACDAGGTAVGFSLDFLDRSADPCVDFYQYACGGWMASNPIPPDQARWARFNELAERNRATLRDILEKAAASPADPDDERIGGYYAACMDEAGVEARSVAAVKPTLDRIGALRSAAELPAFLAELHSWGVGAFFEVGSLQDFKDATQVIAVVDQGGLGMPDRDYYLKEDPKSVELRTKYLEHVRNTLALAGDPPDAAAAGATAVMDLETTLARASLERVKRRDPANIYHPTTRAELLALTPGFGWPAYLEGTGLGKVEAFNVTVPDFFKGMEAAVKAAPLAAVKTYLRWQVLRGASPLLSKAFVDQDFDFYGRTLTGAKELKPRWNRCVQLADRDLGEALGRRYVELTFGAQGKQRMAKLVAALERALERDIETLPWMTEATRKAAGLKLQAVANKIGYPDVWRDYSGVTIERDDLVGNVQRAQAFEFARDLAKIGRPVDKKEWRMSPPTVNAYYSPLNNDINFPAGILQPPFFDNAMDDAVNFGAIGAVIGHELTHGFDDQGRKFDANGNLRDWWTEADGAEFEKRAACFAAQYSGYTAVADVKLDGRLTLGENVADNGGVRIALMALLDVLGGAAAEKADGLTPTQRFFLGHAQIWCQNRTDEVARMLAQTDPHSPGKYRVIGVVSNMPEFAAAFGCKVGQGMVRENACRVW